MQAKAEWNNQPRGLMSTIKDEVIELIRKLPGDATIEDIMEGIYVNRAILKGKQQLRDGEYHTHEEAKEIARKWASR